MKKALDPLYAIFERYLYNSFVEDESHDELVQKVVSDYIEQMQQTGVIPLRYAESIEKDLKEEVLEMLRKKTYGHFNLKQFRKKESAAVAAPAPEAATVKLPKLKYRGRVS